MVAVGVGKAEASIDGTGHVVVGIDLQVGQRRALLPRLDQLLATQHA